MLMNFIDKLTDRIGEANPQLFREVKGRFNPLNLILVMGSSILVQLLVFLYQLTSFPGDKYYLTDTYCEFNKVYNGSQQQLYSLINSLESKISNYQQITLSDPTIIPKLQEQLQQAQTELSHLNNYVAKNFCPPNQINYTLWWRDHWEYYFLTFTVIFIFTLLVAGTYTLIHDLSKEEQRGTLNFIRLSPQAETSILTGKMLGVPSLIYLGILIAIPLHIVAGIGADIAFSYIVSYYLTLIGSGILFYSAAILCGLLNRSFSNFLSWLGSGSVLLFLFMTMACTYFYPYDNDIIQNPFSWVRILSPWEITNYLFPNLFGYSHDSGMKKLMFFALPIGSNTFTLLLFHLANYGICSYGIWQVIKRCFRNPNTTILSKKQSYGLVAFLQIMFLGLSVPAIGERQDLDALYIVMFCNFVLVLCLILILAPPRQTIQDWSRYRHEDELKKSRWQDLMFGEKSPAIVAIGINLLIVTIPLAIWIFTIPESLYRYDNLPQIKVLSEMIFCASLIMLYATVAQLVLLMKNPKRYVFAVLAVGGLIFLPPIALAFLGIRQYDYPIVWLFSTFPWFGLQELGLETIFMALLGQMTVTAVLNFHLYKQMNKLGESATKALLASR
ncbi:ABC transporter permease [Anabaena sp. FACHB-1237]|uniref:ABC transporter permease subunit n=1 Tax=Anabaena sp. FACHB-1237 TaxID=2692769 RepID=UPI00167FE9DA|nr:ABC transporter permease [Anabaena sp. FACHB-1237]MBD2138575.1 ABC transporter permease [Anabaena sp. FACHB-1237]